MKVLILTAKFGMGHLSASNSIKQDILKYHSDADVRVLDFYEYSLPTFSRYVYEAFNLVLKFAKRMYEQFYNNQNRPDKGFNPLVNIMSKSVKRIIEEENPDYIISTFPIISSAVSHCKENNINIDVPLITCITDISSHYEWINKNTDKYIVPCVDTKYELMKKGVSSERICVYGVPVSMKFRKKFTEQTYFNSKDNKLVLINKYKNNKELLIMGGGLGLLPEEKSFYDRLNSINGLHTTIVTGNNEKIYNMLNRYFENITVLGYVDNIEKYMDIADVIITKPGGITIFESIYSLTPIVSFNTTLPNEINNIEFIEDNNMGISFHSNAENNIDRLLRFINDEKKHDSIRKSMVNFVSNLEYNYFENFEEDITSLNEIDKYRNDTKIMDM